VFAIGSGFSSNIEILIIAENTLVSENTEVLNTLRCLDAINIAVLKLEYSLKVWGFFKYWRKRCDSFF
jgi:hypothetical protein